MKIIKIAVCCVLCCILAALLSCSRKGPVDLKVLVPIVDSKTGKDYMDIVHKTHEKKRIDCYQCHHKWENPDRIRNCSNCHAGEVAQITRDTCVKCHTMKN
ncbi:MAG: hypothetical protein JW807_03590 [Spirochaetes bacterium]|nr:hypothetical protein [Spirochaetota bacterium]